jgi:hypothetical protein
MSTNITYSPTGAYCTYSGETGIHEVLAAVEILSGQPEIDDFKYVIHDCLAAQYVTFQQDALTLVSAQAIGLAFSNSKLKGAIITTNEEILKSLAQYSQMTGRTVVVFSTAEDAKSWAASL